MEDIDLIGYCEIHCTTQRALFSKEHLARMLELAGSPKEYIKPNDLRKLKHDFLPVFEEAMIPLCEMARKRMTQPKLRIVK